MARLTGKVEDHVLVANEVRQAVNVSDVGDVDPHCVRNPGGVVQAPSTNVTSAPDSTSTRASDDPMKPSPPVIRTRLPRKGSASSAVKLSPLWAVRACASAC